MVNEQYTSLLYKNQSNTRRAFTHKHDIFTCVNNNIFTHENNKFLSQVLRLPLLKQHNLLKSAQMYFGMIETSSLPPQKSSVTFSIIVGKFSETFVKPLEQFWKIFANVWKVVGNLRKIVKNIIISMFIY